LRINRQIRVPQVRLITADGEQAGVVSLEDALRIAQDDSLDLVEIAPQAKPPVCKIVDYGKFRYQQNKREKEQKRAQHLVKVKEIKVKPNIDSHDLNFKLKHARDFLEKGNKVRITCMFRGRQMVYTNKGREMLLAISEDFSDIASLELAPKMMGRMMTIVLAPLGKRKPDGTKVSTSKGEQS